MPKRKPFPQFRQLNNIPFDELADHLTALYAEGYRQWDILQQTAGERRVQEPPYPNGRVITTISIERPRVTILAYWEDDSEDDDE